MTKMKMRRLVLGLSQSTLGKKIGVSRWKISYAERGHDVFEPEEASRAAKALGLVVVELFDICVGGAFDE